MKYVLTASCSSTIQCLLDCDLVYVDIGERIAVIPDLFEAVLRTLPVAFPAAVPTSEVGIRPFNVGISRPLPHDLKVLINALPSRNIDFAIERNVLLA
jgi:hypothetical protein